MESLARLLKEFNLAHKSAELIKLGIMTPDDLLLYDNAAGIGYICQTTSFTEQEIQCLMEQIQSDSVMISISSYTPSESFLFHSNIDLFDTPPRNKQHVRQSPKANIIANTSPNSRLYNIPNANRDRHHHHWCRRLLAYRINRHRQCIITLAFTVILCIMLVLFWVIFKHKQCGDISSNNVNHTEENISNDSNNHSVTTSTESPYINSSSIIHCNGTATTNVSIPNVIQLIIPSHSLLCNKTIEISTQYRPSVMKIFKETTRLHRAVYHDLVQVHSNQIHIRLPGGPLWHLAENASITMYLYIPDELINICPNNYGIEAFVLLTQTNSDSEINHIFEILPSDSNEAGQILSAQLPLKQFLMSPGRETSIVLSCTPGSMSTSDALSVSPSQCQAMSIKCPVANGCNVMTPFSSLHRGTDYYLGDIGSESSDIFAAADGIVECSQLSDIYGDLIIIRHTDGSATLYGHLSARYKQIGDLVSVADTIGHSDFLYLHFEYAPNGEIFRNKQRIDANTCVESRMHGSLIVGDSGSLADDAFRVAIDGAIIAETKAGQSNSMSVANLISGIHTLTLTVIAAPDGIGTFTISLQHGWTFVDGSELKRDALLIHHNISFQFVVP